MAYPSNFKTLISKPHEIVCKITWKRLIKFSLIPVIYEEIEEFWKKRRAVFPSFVLPYPSFGWSTKSPNFRRNSFCISFFRLPTIFVSSSPRACHFCKPNLYERCRRHSKKRIQECKLEVPNCKWSSLIFFSKILSMLLKSLEVHSNTSKRTKYQWENYRLYRQSWYCKSRMYFFVVECFCVRLQIFLLFLNVVDDIFGSFHTSTQKFNYDWSAKSR